MSQPSRQADRRQDPRVSAAFAFWCCTRGERVGAWMLNMSAGGAAFLIPTDRAPAVGEPLRLEEMHTLDRAVREGALPLPGGGRVLRVEAEQGATSKVAIRFESLAESRLDAAPGQVRTGFLPLPRAGIIPPPACDAGAAFAFPRPARFAAHS